MTKFELDRDDYHEKEIGEFFYSDNNIEIRLGNEYEDDEFFNFIEITYPTTSEMYKDFNFTIKVWGSIYDTYQQAYDVLAKVWKDISKDIKTYAHHSNILKIFNSYKGIY